MSISGPGVEGADRVPAHASSSDPARPALRHEGGELPLLDPAVLRDLQEQLGGPAIAISFARDYAGLWGQRQKSLVAAVERGDRERSLDAVISLKVSSAMVGGVRMAWIAASLEAFIRGGDFPGGRGLLAMVAHSGHATVKELQANYLTKNG
jgi:hypothetical protein